MKYDCTHRQKEVLLKYHIQILGFEILSQVMKPSSTNFLRRKCPDYQ